MREVRCGGLSRWHVLLAMALLAVSPNGVLSRRAEALIKYGPLQISGNLETQNLVRDPEIDQYQFIQNRNTFRLRVDWDWLQNGKFVDQFNVPFIERSKLFVLYRGVYDGFYDIAPGGRMIGQTKFDDYIGGPIIGNRVGSLGPDGKLKPGLYSRLTDNQRRDESWENTLREAYVDLKLANAPVSFRLGRQQVIWGESDQFRLMDIWNPLDTTWHFQQESWDNIRIPLWLGKGLWDIGELGPLSNTFLEVVYNPFDFQPNAKLTFLPQPWGVPFADPLRDGQIQQVGNNQYFATKFDLQGTSIRRGDFKRNPQDASEVGVRFHGVTPQGLEFSANYLYARARGVGANGPLGVKIDEVDLYPGKSTSPLGSLNNAGTFLFGDGQSRLAGTALVRAKVKFPYNHIFGLTANYFEGDYTSSVLRMEMAYVTGEPYQTVEADKLAPARICSASGCGPPSSLAPLGFDKRDSWAGMIGFDRPTWIRAINSKATWFLSGQFFWSYIPGNVSFLRGNGNASNTPYFTPSNGLPGSGSQGLGTWASGPYAGIQERVQAGSQQPGVRILPGSGTVDQGDVVHRWEHLITFAGTSFYRSGTVVPFIADAWDPVDDNNEILWNVDYYYSNNFIITLEQKFFMTYGSQAPSNDPWFAAGRFDRRDETGVKLTYQF